MSTGIEVSLLKINVMGVAFDNVTLTEALDKAQALLDDGGKGFCVTPNAEILHYAQKNPAYQALLNRAWLVIPDGAGAVLGSEILGTPLKEKVAGIDFADHLCDRLRQGGYRLYLLGGKPGVAEAAAAHLCEKYPGLNICGTHHGYFAPEETDSIIRQINATNPDVLYVCMGAPKQEEFMDRYGEQLSARFMIGLGGSLDVFSGNLRRAPLWMRKCSLEWLYRILQDPVRLGRSASRPQFILSCLKERRRQQKNG